jgi:hypothetical protein
MFKAGGHNGRIKHKQKSPMSAGKILVTTSKPNVRSKNSTEKCGWEIKQKTLKLVLKTNIKQLCKNMYRKINKKK